jgi:hypothetical protein
MPALETTPDDAYERKVFQAFVHDGRLKAIPAKRKKREILLKHMVNAFERRRVYREAEVNAVLAEFHEDVASLRREMIDMGLLIRYRGEYARPEAVELPQTQ